MRESDFLVALRFQRAADYLALAKKELNANGEHSMAAEVTPLIHRAERASADWIAATAEKEDAALEGGKG